MATDGTFEYGLGQVTPSSIDVQPPSSGNDWVVFIGYTSGNDGRQFDIEFRFSNTPATMTYDGENPSKDYVSLKDFICPPWSRCFHMYVHVQMILSVKIIPSVINMVSIDKWSLYGRE